VRAQILAVVPGEVGDSSLSLRQRDSFVGSLQEALPTVFGFFSQAVETGWGREEIMAAAVSAVNGWASCEHSGLTVPVLAASFAPVYRLLFELIRTGQPLATESTTALISAIGNTSVAELEAPRCFEEVATAVLGCSAQYEQALTAQDEKACAHFTQLAVALASRVPKFLLQGRAGEAGSTLLQALLVAVQHPAIAVADLALEFWLQLSCVWPSFTEALSTGEVCLVHVPQPALRLAS
jgi:hypothetical protein